MPAIPHHGKRLLRALEEQERTQSWLADQLGVTRQAITKYIKTESWQPRTTYKVARALGLTPAFFVEEKEKGTVAPLPPSPDQTTKESG